MSKQRDLVPFTHFVVKVLNANEFLVSVSKPSLVRYALESETALSEHAIDTLTSQRFLFINNAVQEKLDREKP